MKIITSLFIVGLIVFMSPAFSNSDAPVTYAKERIIITSLATKTDALIHVDMRSGDTPLNPDWFQIAGFKPNEGLLLTYGTTQILTIQPANILAAYDIIAINAYGEIILILPNIVLAHLSKPISTTEPAAAILYVDAGTSASLAIAIGDHIKHRMFQDRPTVIDEKNSQAEPSAATETKTEQPPEASKQPEGISIINPQERRRPAANPPQATPSSSTSPNIAKPTPPSAPEAPVVEPVIQELPKSNLQQKATSSKMEEAPTNQRQQQLLNMLLKQ